MVFLALLTTITVPLSFQVGSTAPTPPTTHHKPLIDDWTPFLETCLTCLQWSIWCHAAVEIILHCAPTTPANNIAKAVYLTAATDIHVSQGRLLGAIFCATGALLRWHCYREMGRHFTFHITVMTGHKLVTSGPYGFVRHPSYSGGLLLDIGILIWHLSPGSWVIESGIMRMLSFWIVAAPSIILMCFSTRMHFWRCGVEDAIMRKEFGEEWDRWANAVPYRLIPGVF